MHRFASLAARMEQYIQGQSRDLVDQAYTKIVSILWSMMLLRHSLLLLNVSFSFQRKDKMFEVAQALNTIWTRHITFYATMLGNLSFQKVK